MKRLALASALGLLACAGLGYVVFSQTANLPITEWQLATVDGQAPGYGATLSLAEPGRVSGQAPCNRYFAELTRDGAGFVLGPIGATKMACDQMQGEAAFFAALGTVTAATEAPGVLELSGSGPILGFVPPKP
jgi:heat shock protein HslJ